MRKQRCGRFFLYHGKDVLILPVFCLWGINEGKTDVVYYFFKKEEQADFGKFHQK